MTALLVSLLAVTLAGRLVWIEEYFRRYRSHYGDLKGSLRKTRVQVENPSVDAAKAKEKQALYVQSARRQFEMCLLGGTLGVTAWSALYAAKSSSGFQISGLSLRLLFVGVFALITGPVLAKAEALFFSYMVRESAGYVGFSAVVFSLTSIAWDLTGVRWGVVAAVFAALVAVSDLKQDVKLVDFLKSGIPRMPRAQGCRCNCCPH
ncbi:hypothetical protein [Streptomyces sp. NPDC001410]|uniref:hypothetical protein n=1 Tax=Streptomyces sp. NPDC001410 TaxID=3364574 RepID=UPI0036841F49